VEKTPIKKNNKQTNKKQNKTKEREKKKKKKVAHLHLELNDFSTITIKKTGVAHAINNYRILRTVRHTNIFITPISSSSSRLSHFVMCL